MNHFQIEPEVAGGWGDGTEADTSVHPPVVKKLHYVFDGWSGDALVTSFPCFLVIKELGAALEKHEFSGFRLASAKISTSEQFQELFPGKRLPAFRWLQITGSAGVADFGLGRNRLVVSERTLKVLKEFGIQNSEVREWYG